VRIENKTMNTTSRSLARLVACSLALGLLQPALADVTSASDTATAEDFAFAKRLSRVFKTVAERREKSVVHITQLRTIQPTDFFGRPVGRGQLQQAGLGSGVIVSSDGVIVTNNHVVRGADKLRVKLSDEREFDAVVLGTDEATDIAVLKVDVGKESLPAADFADSDQLEVGEWVVAIGSPFGLDNSVTQGIISAKGRTVTPRETGVSFEDYIQTDAAINPGNSGGPLLNLEGQIVGINTAIASRTGGYDGIGFCVPGNTVKNVLESIQRTGRVARGYLGIEMSEQSSSGGGVLVKTVVDGSPADEAGLKSGDVITRFQGSSLSLDRLRNAIAAAPAGSKVNIEVSREGETKTLQATLGDLSAAKGYVFIDALGVEVELLPDDIARQVDAKAIVRVASIQETGRAAMSGLRAGDIIVSVDGDGYADIAELQKNISKGNFSRGLRLDIIRPLQGGNSYRRGNIVVQE
jgi:serine protease Do